MILLEVVLATGLFAMMALAILTGINSCFRALGTMQLESQAADLAVSKVSEVHIGILPPEDDGPNEYEEGQGPLDWTWEIITTETETDIELGAPQLLQVQVVITNVPSGYTYSMQFLTPEPQTEESGQAPEELAGGLAP